VDVNLGSEGVLTGTARVAQEARERSAAEVRRHDHSRKLRLLGSKRKAIEAQIALLQAQADSEEAELTFTVAEAALQEKAAQRDSIILARRRGGAKKDNRRANEKR
jgi:circadian clock protein KaiC